jgi:hypothetical protein
MKKGMKNILLFCSLSLAVCQHSWRGLVTPARRGKGVQKNANADVRTPAECHAAISWAQASPEELASGLVDFLASHPISKGIGAWP